MDYQQAKIERDRLEAAQRAAFQTLRAIPGYGSGAMGMTPDAVKATPEWQAAANANGRAFRALQDFNRDFVKRFRKEIRASRKRSFYLA
jgi:hypothetical protein